MKTSYVPYQECETMWSIPLADIPDEETFGHAKASTPKTKAKTEKTNPVIADARRRAGETEITNPIVENALKRAGETKTEVQSHV